MLIREIAKQYNMTEDEMKILISEKIMDDFVRENMTGDEASPKMVHAIEKLMAMEEEKKNIAQNDTTNAFIPPLGDDQVDETVGEESDTVETTPEPMDNDTSSEVPEPVTDVADESSSNASHEVPDENQDENTNDGDDIMAAPEDLEDPESEKPKTRKRRKIEDQIEISSDIEKVPAVELRKFLADNFSIKPEKIFYLDDAGVREKIDEKYIVIARDDAFIFVKRSYVLPVISRQ